MFKILKFIIWLVGTIVVALFVLNYFGYEINRDYFDESKAKCEEKFNECKKELIHQGLDNAQCDFKCVNPRLVIKKK